MVKKGLVEKPQGGLVEQQLKNEGECSLPPKMSVLYPKIHQGIHFFEQIGTTY